MSFFTLSTLNVKTICYQINSSSCHLKQNEFTVGGGDNVPCIFTRISRDCFHRLSVYLLCSCDVFRAMIITSLIGWFISVTVWYFHERWDENELTYCWSWGLGDRGPTKDSRDKKIVGYLWILALRCDRMSLTGNSRQWRRLLLALNNSPFRITWFYSVCH